MKKILAIILSVMMVASLAVLASAEEAPLTTTAALTTAADYTTITATPDATTVAAKGAKIVVNYVVSNNVGIMALTMERLSTVVPAGLTLVEEKNGEIFTAPTTGADKVVFLDANGDNKTNGVLYTATYEVTADVKIGDTFTFAVPAVTAGNMDEQAVKVNCVSATVTVSCEHKNTEIKDAKTATCTEAGYTGDKYCKDCGTKIEAGKEIAMLEHDVEIVNKKNASCTETGYTGDKVCKVCGKKIAEGTVIGQLLHTGGTATCTKKAVCTLCKQEYGNLNPDNHTSTKIVNAKAATSTAEGYTGDTVCADCGKTIKKGETIAKIINPPTNDNSIVTVVVIAVLGIAAIAGAAVVYNKRREF